MAGPLSITNCEATSDIIVVTFSEPVSTSATTPGNYTVTVFPGGAAGQFTVNSLASNDTAAILTFTSRLPQGQWIQVEVTGNVTPITPRGGGAAITSPNNIFFTQVHGDDVGVAAGDIALNTGSIATSSKSTSQAVEDIAAFSVLTEELGYAPSPVARIPGGGGAMAPAAGGTLGQTAMKAISDVLGWQVKPADYKGFVGALNASFTLKEIEGHTQAIWSPRTYAIQTDLSGGITGAQASVYQRAKDALDKSLPLLEGLKPLFMEAKDEDVAALRATVRTQFTDLVKEFGLLGGPRVSRVTQFFSLLLGAKPVIGSQGTPSSMPVSIGPGQTIPSVQTDPDKIDGSLGNLRTEFGFGTADDQVNTVEDEQNATNFRIVSDYVTSLAQSWLNNLSFFGLQAQKPFFGTQLVLLSRQLSVIAESVNEVRFTLDSVFIGPAERQTLQINFPFDPISQTTPPSMFLEDLLTWIDSFASEEGPRLIQDGGKFAVSESFVPIGTQLQNLVAGAENATNINSLPRGYRTARVQRSLEELADQLQELVNLAVPISHVITPEPQPALSVLGINPNVLFLSTVKAGVSPLPITVIGTGFDVGITRVNQQTGASVNIDALPLLISPISTPVASENLIFAQLDLTTLPAPGNYVVTIQVTNRDSQSASLVTSFTVLP